MSKLFKYKEIQEWDKETRQAQLSRLRKELFEMRMKKSMVPLEKPHLLRVLRRNIARIMTSERGI